MLCNVMMEAGGFHSQPALLVHGIGPGVAYWQKHVKNPGKTARSEL